MDFPYDFISAVADSGRRPPVGTRYRTSWDRRRWEVLEWLDDGRHRYRMCGSPHVFTAHYVGFPSSFILLGASDDPNGR